MKLSAILVSVNLVATLPTAVQAAPTASTEKDTWLTDNLAALQKTKPQRKFSIPDTTTPPLIGHRMMPFLPGRRLPSAKEVQLADSPTNVSAGLKPSYGNTAQPLSGQVYPYANLPEESTAPLRPSTLPINKKGSPRAIAGQNPVLPGQVAPVTAANSALPVIPEPPTVLPSTVESVPAFDFSSASKAASLKRPTILVQAPTLTNEQRAMLDELIETSQPQSESNHPHLQMLPSANSRQLASSAGPTPFPLNLLPQHALKQLISNSAQRQTNAPAAYFGSWHRIVASSSAAAPYNLQPVGFTSHLTRTTNYNSRTHQTNSSHRKKNQSTTPRSNTQLISALPLDPQPRLAPYALYSRSHTSLF